MSLQLSGLLEPATLARMQGVDPECITVIAVEPANMEPGIELSETVSRRLRDVCHLVMEEVRAVLAL